MVQIMKPLPLILFLLITSITTILNANEQEKTMSISGKFEITLEPQTDESNPAGRMTINKVYTGSIKGTGIGQMISKRIENGAAVYFAVEEFSGSVKGKSGAFTLIHKGFMSKDSQTLDISILKGSGQGELENISGTMDITQKDGSHFYELDYQL